MSLEIYGITSGGKRVALRCNEDGELLVSGGTGGGGGGGDASAANQTTQIGLETAIRDRLAKGQGTAANSLSVVLASDVTPSIKTAASNTATITSVDAQTTSVQLLAVNANRRRLVIVNDSTAAMFLAFAATASSTAYTYELFGGDTYESPGDSVYSGAISAIWTAANGAARITEMS